MKKLQLLTLFLFGLIVFSGCASTDLKAITESSNQDDNPQQQGYKQNNSEGTIPIHTVFGNYKRYDSVDELAETAELIVVGKPQANIEESSFVSVSETNSRRRQPQNQIESVVVKDNSGLIVDAYTITPFQVQKNLKGQLDTKEIQVIQAVDTATYPNLANVYSIIAINQGKFNLDQADSGESQIEERNPQYRSLKDKVRSSFGRDVSSVPQPSP